MGCGMHHRRGFGVQLEMARSLRVFFLFTAFAAAGTFAAEEKSSWARPAERTGLLVALVPMGEVKPRSTATAARAIQATYGFRTVVEDRREHPPSAWYAPRRRYRAEEILDWLRPLEAAAAKVMGVTERDISTTKGRYLDFGICGLADLGGRAAVISTYRIARKMGKTGPGAHARIFERRLADLATHELGHQLGLDHCPNRGCVMEDAKGTVTTFDRSTGRLCATCRRILADLGIALP